MEKILLVFIFIGGLRTAIEEWKVFIEIAVEYRKMLKRGFHPDDIQFCNCDGCRTSNPDYDMTDHKKDLYNEQLKNIVRVAYNSLFYILFILSISLLALYNYLQLTFNF